MDRKDGGADKISKPGTSKPGGAPGKGAGGGGATDGRDGGKVGVGGLTRPVHSRELWGRPSSSVGG